MGELYERLLDVHPTKGKIAAHALLALVGEQRRGALTTAQAQNILMLEYGGALGTDATGSNAGMQELVDLLGTVQTGATTGNQLSRLARLAEVQDVLLLADLRITPYATPVELRTRFGVPDRT